MSTGSSRRSPRDRCGGHRSLAAEGRRRQRRGRGRNTTDLRGRERARALLHRTAHRPCVRRRRAPERDASRRRQGHVGSSAPACTTRPRRPDAGERGVEPRKSADLIPVGRPGRGRSARPACTASSARYTPHVRHDHRRGRAGRDAHADADRRARRAIGPRRRRRRSPPPPRPGATATPDGHLNTPAPGNAARKDTTAPRLTGARPRRSRQAPSSASRSPSRRRCAIVARRGKRTVTSATLHVAAGTRSVTLRSSSLRKKGTYTLELRAVDAMGNAAQPGRSKTLKVKR